MTIVVMVTPLLPLAAETIFCHSNTMPQPKSAAKASFFSCTDEEMEYLLRLTQEYKAQKAIENIDWESCVIKYGDILLTAEYPTASAANEKGFPHTVEDIIKTALTMKLKSIRSKYRHAVDSGRSGHGRVALLFFEVCEKIWGGSLATTTLGSGLETSDMVDPDTPVS